MQNQRSRLVRISIVGLVGGLALGIGIGLFLWGDMWGAPERVLKAASESYKRGVESLETGDPLVAENQFEQVRNRADKALQRLEKERGKPEVDNPEAKEKLDKLEGKAHYLSAIALRDREYARARQENNPLPEVVDSSTGKKFRTILRIRDPKELTQAVDSLRKAAQLLPNDAEVQQEALRTELMLRPLNWKIVEELARNRLALEPKDIRPLYLLARIGFEQPTTDEDGKVTLTPPAKRDRKKVLDAEQKLAKVLQAKDYPIWRTLHLQARILRWLHKDSGKPKSPEEASKRDKQLHALLLDQDQGVLARAKKGEGLKERVSRWDIEGVLGLHVMALELALEDARTDREQLPGARAVLDRTLAFCKQMAEQKNPGFWLPASTRTAIKSLLLFQSNLEDPASPSWQKRLEEVQSLAEKVLADGAEKNRRAVDPELFADLVRLLVYQSQLEKRFGNQQGARHWRKQAEKWANNVETRFRNQWDKNQLQKVQEAVSELNKLEGSAVDLPRQMKRMRALASPRALAWVHFLEGIAAEEEDQLARAREKLEAARSSRPDLQVRCDLVLGGLYLAMGEPSASLGCFNRIVAQYPRLEDLPLSDRIWAWKYVHNDEEFTFLHIVALLRTASREPSSASTHQKAVAKMLNILPAGGTFGRRARLEWIACCRAKDEEEQASKALAQFQKDYPEDIQGVYWAAQQARKKGLPKGDAIIRTHARSHPDSRSAQLLWAQWLVETGRPGQARDYLDDATRFPEDTRKLPYMRTLAAALLSPESVRGQPQVFRHLPTDSTTPELLIRLARHTASVSECQDTLNRYEHRGLLLCWKAELARQTRQREEALKAYTRALDFAAVRRFAERGLRVSLFALASRNPRRVLERAGALQANPRARHLALLLSACCYLLVDELGGVDDSWENKKSLTSALTEWKKTRREQGKDHVATLLTCAEFWRRAGKMDQAYSAVDKALQEAPGDTRALHFSLDLLLHPNIHSFDLLAQPLAPYVVGPLAERIRAEKVLKILEQKAPQDAWTLWWKGVFQGRHGQETEAIQTWERLVSQHRAFEPGYQMLLRLQERRGSAHQSRTAIGRWSKQCPDDRRPGLLEVRALAREGMLDQARNRANEWKNREIQKIRNRMRGEILLAWLPEVAVAPTGRQREQQVRLQEASRALDMELGLAFAGGGALNEAEKRVSQAPHTKQDHAALVLKGYLYQQREEWKKAHEVYRQALAPEPWNKELASRLALVLLAMKQKDAAYRVMRQARKGRFSNEQLPGARLPVSFLATFATVHRALGRQALAGEMRSLYESGRKRYKGDPRLCLPLAQAYTWLGQPARAKDMLKMASTLAQPAVPNGLSKTQRASVLRAVTGTRDVSSGG